MESIACPVCSATVPPGAVYCDTCGNPLIPTSNPDMDVPEILACPNCHAATRAGDVYCDNCGYLLQPESGNPTSAPVEPQTPANDPAPRLIIQPDSIVVELAPNQAVYIIGREDPGSGNYPDVDLVPFGGEEGGVSRRHAKITRRDETYFIEDLNSVNYTFVNKKKIAVGVGHPLQDGDEIRLGRVMMRFETDL